MGSSDRPVDPSTLVDGDTPGDLDADEVVTRWEDIEERGHPLGPDRVDDNEVSDDYE